jgi:hypothetical protein
VVLNGREWYPWKHGCTGQPGKGGGLVGPVYLERVVKRLRTEVFGEKFKKCIFPLKMVESKN